MSTCGHPLNKMYLLCIRYSELYTTRRVVGKIDTWYKNVVQTTK